MASAAVPAKASGRQQSIPKVIGASALGTIFEWYDFFIYGTLASAGIIGRTFFPTGSETMQTLLAWAGFAVGFGFRPLGAIIFGYLGDRLGRKYTFLATITLMGIATAGVGLVPSYAAIGMAAPILIILLRICQGLALGGEYGGAAIYVAEHAPGGRSGFYTSFIQAAVAGGFILSLLVVLGCKERHDRRKLGRLGLAPAVPDLAGPARRLGLDARAARREPGLRRDESGGEDEQESVRRELHLSRQSPAADGRAVRRGGGADGHLVHRQFPGAFLPHRPDESRGDERADHCRLGHGRRCGLVRAVRHLSDRLGRRRVIATGYVLTLLLLFPLFWLIGSQANPALSLAAERAPIAVTGPQCDYDPFASSFAKGQATPCAQLIDHLAGKGVPYRLHAGDSLGVTIGNVPAAATDNAAVDAAILAAGYDLVPQTPPLRNLAVIFLAVVGLSFLAGMTFGPVAALLCEMFPPAVRYSSMSIPYHIGTGYFGGFLPLIASYMVAKSGNPYAGLCTRSLSSGLHSWRGTKLDK